MRYLLRLIRRLLMKITTTVEIDDHECSWAPVASVLKALHVAKRDLAGAEGRSPSGVPVPAHSEDCKVPNPIVEKTVTEVTEAITVMKSATTLILGFKDPLDKAVADALANGASAAELAPLTDLSNELDVNEQALAAAVAANTPTPPEPAPQP